MTLGVVVLSIGHRRLGHQGAQPGVVGCLSQVAELLIGERQLLAEPLEALTDLRQAAFDEGPGHARQCTPDRRPARICDDAQMALSGAAGGAVTAAAVALALLTGCGGGTDRGTGGCGPITREALDPAYLVHVVGNETSGVEYLSDPPTSGPHQPAPAVSGVSDETLSKPVQVGILERGDVLVQYDPEEIDAAEVEPIAAAGVVVAPNPDLPDPVVATAWLFTQHCQEADPAALEEFIDERLGKGPEG